MAIIGIDLGTTNSLVAVWDGEPRLIPNALGEFLTPSVVGVDNNQEILVGSLAQERLYTHPDHTVAHFKRDMGTDRITSLGKHRFRPEELSALVVKSLKRDVEAYLEKPVTEAVISVPAYFNDTQRKATRAAGELAGLRVERVINEPTAAAMAYGIHHREKETTILVFDLGGGTFDVSILEFFDGIMEVRASAGDNFLGGEDFTQSILQGFLDFSQIDKSQLDHKTRNRLRHNAEWAKQALSQQESFVFQFPGKPEFQEWTLDHELLESLSKPLIDRMRVPVERALRDASLGSHDLDSILLIGGATRMPLVKSLIAKMFGKLPLSHIHPDEAVALGAAVQAGLKARDEALNEFVLTDVCPYTLGVETIHMEDSGKLKEGYFCPMIERNTVIPASRVEQFANISRFQSRVEVPVYQGESRMVKNNIHLGDLKFPIPRGRPGTQTVEVRFTYDINGILEVEATVVSTGLKKRLVIEKNPGVLSKEEIERRLQQLAVLKIHPREETENRHLIAKGERLYEEALGKNRIDISDELSLFEGALDKQDPSRIRKARERFKKFLAILEEEMRSL